MKRLIVFLLLCLLVAIPTTGVWADVIVEPENNFLQRHRQECVRVERDFTANTMLEALDRPGGRAVETVEAGQRLHITFTYLHRGREWGITYDHWVPMEALTLLYDADCFQEDHQDEYAPYTGDPDLFRDTTESIVGWSFPGSGSYDWVMNRSVMGDLSIDHVYLDSQGVEWGYLTSIRGSGWVCLADPFNRDLPANPDNPQTGVWISPEYPKTLPLATIAVILVVVLALGTAILIRFVWKRKQ